MGNKRIAIMSLLANEKGACDRNTAGPQSTILPSHLAIPCQVAPQHSLTPFHQILIE